MFQIVNWHTVLYVLCMMQDAAILDPTSQTHSYLSQDLSYGQIFAFGALLTVFDKLRAFCSQIPSLHQASKSYRTN